MAKLGKTTTITITPSGSGATDLLANMCVYNIGDVGYSIGTIDATCHGSGAYKKYIEGLKDLDQFDVVVDYKDKATSEALWGATGSNSVVITIPEDSGSTTLTFSAVIVAVKTTFPTEDVIRTTISLKPDGITAPTWATVS